MAKWGSSTMTKVGMQLLAKAVTGVPLKITKAVFGDDILPPNTDLSELTQITSKKLYLTIVGEHASSGIATLTLRYTNRNLAESFWTRIVGLYAEDPDLGEVLYTVAYAGEFGNYIPDGSGTDIVEHTIDIKTVISSAPTVIIVFDDSAIYITKTEFEAYTNSMPVVGPPTTSPSHFWVQENSDGKLHPMTKDATKKEILGGDGTDIRIIQGRITQVEREQANMALDMEARKIYPDYNAFIAEDFTNPDKVDQFSCDITSIVAGDDSIDVTNLRGIIPGGRYAISDGVNQEPCQVKSAVKNGTTYRIIMMEPIVNTYLTGQTYLYRTTAQIQSTAGVAEGAGDQKSLLWKPATVWNGAAANVTITITPDLQNAVLSGDAAITSDGFITLQ